jgi:hypothetical protein
MAGKNTTQWAQGGNRGAEPRSQFGTVKTPNAQREAMHAAPSLSGVSALRFTDAYLEGKTSIHQIDRVKVTLQLLKCGHSSAESRALQPRRLQRRQV